jgi:hypothetical protein
MPETKRDENKKVLDSEITSKDLPSINVGDLAKKGGNALSGMLSSLSSRLNLALKQQPIDRSFVGDLKAKIKEIEDAMRAAEKEQNANKGGDEKKAAAPEGKTGAPLNVIAGSDSLPRRDNFGSVGGAEQKETTGLTGGEALSSFNIGAPTRTRRQLEQRQQMAASSNTNPDEHEEWAKKIRAQQEEAARVAAENKANSR